MAYPQSETFKKQVRRFHRWGIAALVIVYLVILAGGIVRMTGSGMGCPDWPKCFGRLVPPTSESQLPAGWQETYKTSCEEEKVFNAANTWTEYINRLIGAIAGLVVLGLTVVSLPFLKVKGQRWRTLLAGFTLFAILFQAWLGKLVVDSCLTENMITIHMFVAMLIMCLLIFAIYTSSKPFLVPLNGQRSNLKWVAFATMLLLVSQVLLGTQVREAIDEIARNMGQEGRSSWVDAAGSIFIIHRTFSWVVAFAVLFLSWMVIRHARKDTVTKRMAQLGILLVLLEFALGVALAEFGMPRIAQPLHLLFGSMLISTTFWLFLAYHIEVDPDAAQISSSPESDDKVELANG
ncbi:MAG: COX15/CtaA family protein [Bacteroidota bacterium]